MARTKTTLNPPPSIDYKSLYRWAPDSLLAETSQVNTFKDIEVYKKNESDEKFHVFGRFYLVGKGNSCVSTTARTLKNLSSSCTQLSSSALS